MSHLTTQDDRINVAAVCGNEVRIYTDADNRGRRGFMRMVRFNTYGAAKLFADEFEEAQRDRNGRRGP